MELRQEFIGVGCNRTPHSVSWLSSTQPTIRDRSLVAYGGGSLVAVYDVVHCKVTAAMAGHKGQVNCVQWLETDKGNGELALEILSGSSDGTVRVWSYDGAADLYEATAVLKDHTSSVSNLTAITVGEKSFLVSCSSTGAVIVHGRETAGSEWTLLQRIPFKPKSIVQSSSLVSTTGPGGCSFVILALGSVDTKVHLYASPLSGAVSEVQFAPVAHLEGHENWVRDVSFCSTDEGDLMLASASQDGNIRLWRFTKLSNVSELSVQDELIDDTADGVGGDIGDDDDNDDDDDEYEEGGFNQGLITSYGQRGHRVRVKSDNDMLELAVLLDAMLIGHEERVMTARWRPVEVSPEGKKHQPMVLLSAATDRTMMVWRPDHESDIWQNEVVVGTYGGHTIGFYSGNMGPGGRSILGVGFTGSFHLWTTPDSENNDSWAAELTPSGHFGPVVDLAWDSEKNYILSTSKDQTTRVFAKWPSTDEKQSEAQLLVQDRPTLSPQGEWHELARPQVHGFDLHCMTPVLMGPTQPFPHLFASGAEEKVIRVFLAPLPFVQSAQGIAGIASSIEPESVSDSGFLIKRALKAHIPELGLSNKAVMYGDEAEVVLTAGSLGHMFEVKQEQGDDLSHPPFEEELIGRTLWPEVEKLYGHGYELISMCSSNDGALIASASSAKKMEHATVRLWDTKSWTQICELPGHTLSVVGLQFSPDNKYLLSVSRDRHFCLYKRTEDAKMPFRLVLKHKAHSRIIWGCSWSPCGNLFATGSRDKRVKVWKRGPNAADSKGMEPWVEDSCIFTPSPVVSVEMAPVREDE